MRPVVTLQFPPVGFRAWVRTLSAWCGSHLVQTVPEEHSVCEYECQEPLCTSAKSAFCQKRHRALLAIGRSELGLSNRSAVDS